jgi:hypothetical protein
VVPTGAIEEAAAAEGATVEGAAEGAERTGETPSSKSSSESEKNWTSSGVGGGGRRAEDGTGRRRFRKTQPERVGGGSRKATCPAMESRCINGCTVSTVYTVRDHW